MATQRLTTVRLCRAVPLDNSYKDVMTFQNATAQQAYFAGKTVLTATDLSYQRESLFIRYSADYDTIINCNYLCYQNKAHGNKWFYAFISRMEYINDGLTDIYFEIDSWNTFMFDIAINGAFVEREHVNNDTPGANILPEPVDEGIYKYTEVTAYPENVLKEAWYLLAVASDWSGGVIPNYYNGLFSGLDYYAFPNNENGRNGLAFEIGRQEAKKQGSVQWIAVIPRLAMDAANVDENNKLISTNTIGMQEAVIQRPTSTMSSGYTPRNKKLLTYPFSYFSISNNDGTIKEYHYEEFTDLNNNNIPFTLYCDIGNTPTVRCTPLKYMGNPLEMFDAGLMLNWGTQVSWVTDTYTQWLQANRLNFATKQTGMLMQYALSAATGNTTALAWSVGNSILTAGNMIAENYQMRLKSNKVHGTQGGEALDLDLGIKRFFFYQIAIRPEDATRIDGFFDRFGYTVNANKIPNIVGRYSWNYVKCRNIQLTGNCPAEHLLRVKNMFLNGVTFWHSGKVGDYTQNNTIVGG